MPQHSFALQACKPQLCKWLLRCSGQAPAVMAATLRVTGLHALGLDISRVSVDGLTAAYSLRPAPWRDAAAGAGAGGQQQGPKTAEAAAEQGYLAYQEALRREAEPELSIQLPAVVSREPAEAPAAAGGAAADTRPLADGKSAADGTSTAGAGAPATGSGGAGTGGALPSMAVPAGDAHGTHLVSRGTESPHGAGWGLTAASIATRGARRQRWCAGL